MDGFVRENDADDTVTAEVEVEVDAGAGGGGGRGRRRRLVAQTRTKVGQVPCKEISNAIERMTSGDFFATTTVSFGQAVAGHTDVTMEANLELTARRHWHSDTAFGIADVRETQGAAGPFSVVCEKAKCSSSVAAGGQGRMCTVYSGAQDERRRRLGVEGEKQEEGHFGHAIVDLDYLNAPAERPEELAERIAKVTAASMVAATAAFAGRSFGGRGRRLVTEECC